MGPFVKTTKGIIDDMLSNWTGCYTVENLLEASDLAEVVVKNLLVIGDVQ